MSSQGAIKWLRRLQQPRTLESLITEVYGEATWYGCLFEREVADLLNFYDLRNDPVGTMMRGWFNTEDFTLNDLIKQVQKRKILPDEELALLRDGKDARNELIHRLVAKRAIPSRADRELFLAEIDALYARIWTAHRLACELKKQFAAAVGLTEDRVAEMLRQRQEEARIEDENIRRLIGEEGNDAQNQQ